MDLTLNTCKNTLTDHEYVAIDINIWLPIIQRNLNLLPSNMASPDEEAIIKMVMGSIQSRLQPSPHVLRAKCDHIFAGANSSIRESIFASMFGLSLTIIETYNHLQLWSLNGIAMYEFDHFLNEDTVIIRRIKNFTMY